PCCGPDYSAVPPVFTVAGASGGPQSPLHLRRGPNKNTAKRGLSPRCFGSPVRVRLWFSRGKKTTSLGTPKCCKARNHCSPCSIGTRKSMSEWRISVGVLTSFAYLSGEAFQY